MSYQELGEARILKRYAKQDFVKPVRKAVTQTVLTDNWQSLEQATTRFLKDVKPACVRPQ